MKRNRIREIAIGAAVTTLTVVLYLFGLSPDKDKPRFSEKITPLSAAGHRINGEEPYYWIDENRLLVFGFDHLARSRKSGTDDTVDSALYILDANTNTYTKYVDLGHWYARLCYSRGKVWYVVDYDRTTTHLRFKSGDFEAEVEGAYYSRHGLANRPVNQYDCLPNDTTSDLLPEHQGEGNLVVRLRSEDGYIFVGRANEPHGDIVNRGNQNDFVRLYQPGKEPVDLPILAKELSFFKEHYSEYTREYIFSSSIPPNGDFWAIYWPPDLPKVRYFLSSDGKVRKEEYPASTRKALRGSSYVPYPTKRGNYFEGFDKGSWIYNNGKLYQISDGSIDPQVSPDGCKMAISEEHIVILDFCDPNRDRSFHFKKK